jgi:hypothetical protein
MYDHREPFTYRGHTLEARAQMPGVAIGRARPNKVMWTIRVDDKWSQGFEAYYDDNEEGITQGIKDWLDQRLDHPR